VPCFLCSSNAAAAHPDLFVEVLSVPVKNKELSISSLIEMYATTRWVSQDPASSRIGGERKSVGTEGQGSPLVFCCPGLAYHVVPCHSCHSSQSSSGHSMRSFPKDSILNAAVMAIDMSDEARDVALKMNGKPEPLRNQRRVNGNRCGRVRALDGHPRSWERMQFS
jgi:hypothetical protein